MLKKRAKMWCYFNLIEVFINIISPFSWYTISKSTKKDYASWVLEIGRVGDEHLIMKRCSLQLLFQEVYYKFPMFLIFHGSFFKEKEKAIAPRSFNYAPGSMPTWRGESYGYQILIWFYWKGEYTISIIVL